MAQYYIIVDGRQVGPVEKSQLVNYGLNANSKVWCAGMPTWLPAASVPDLADLLGSVPPPFHGGANYSDNGVPPMYAPAKDKVTFGVLALLIGWLGVQYFYVGKTTAGIISIVLSLITCFSIWPIITFVQGIVVLCGTQEEFERKFVDSASTFPLF